MDKKFALYIVIGMAIGALFGTSFGPAIENELLAVAFGALSGVFIGWFIALAVQESKKRSKQ